MVFNENIDTSQKQNNWEEIVESAFADPVKKAILDFLVKEESSFFGNIVEALPFSYLTILENILELKNNGIVFKKQNPAHFSLNLQAFEGKPLNVA